MEATETHRTIAAVWRTESSKVIAGVARMVGDVRIAEDLAQDALVAALEHWPTDGVPQNPGAWLMTTAKRRAIDLIRRDKRLEVKHELVAYELESMRRSEDSDLDAALDDEIGDDLLRLIFTACHPVLTTESRVALTLRLLGGLTTEEIARAFLVQTPTIAQRIVRAKRDLSAAKVPFEVPRWPHRAGPGGASWWPRWALHPAGCHRCMSCPGSDAGGDRLAPNRCTVRSVGRPRALTGRGTQPCRGARDGVRT